MLNEFSISYKKSTSRKHFRELRQSISVESKYLLDTALVSNTAILEAFQNAETILCYYPVRGEPNILPLARYAQSQGKKIAFPISHIKERRLSFHTVSDISELVGGSYGIPEPPIKNTEVTDFSNTFCIVPAMAIGKNGQRLGYGGGYYDRFLSSYNGVSAGLVYSFFLVDAVPAEKHDVALDIIITEKGASFINGKKRTAQST